MSDKAASDFIKELLLTPSLQKELTAALAGTAGASDSLSRIVGFAAERGYEVTPQELGLVVANASEVKDEQLSHVAGGVLTPVAGPVQTFQTVDQSYQTADQRANQLMNILSSILKTQNEMNAATSRGML